MPPDNNHSSDPAPAPFLEKEVATAALLRTLDQLVGRLGEAGIGGETLNLLLGSKVQVECLLCKIRLTGQELLDANIKSELELPPKLRRMQLGYCARASCESRFYRVFLLEDSSINWSEVWPVEGPSKPEPIPESVWNTETFLKLAAVYGRTVIHWWRAAPLAGKIALCVILTLAFSWASEIRMPAAISRGRVYIVEEQIVPVPSQTTNATPRPGARTVK
jgi:hypothetical protein